MKKVKLFLIASALTFAVTGCGGSTGSSTGGSSTYKDGEYYSELAETPESGWKDNVTVTVSSGKITAVTWSGTNENVADDKKTYAEKGEYNMISQSAIGKEWHEQAKVMEDELIRVQDPDKIKVTTDGYVDGVSGCTMHVNSFVSLAKDALAKAK